jgi:hypothetical protein
VVGIGAAVYFATVAVDAVAVAVVTLAEVHGADSISAGFRGIRETALGIARAAMLERNQGLFATVGVDAIAVTVGGLALVHHALAGLTRGAAVGSATGGSTATAVERIDPEVDFAAILDISVAVSEVRRTVRDTAHASDAVRGSARRGALESTLATVVH